MAELKTKPTQASVERYYAGIEDAARRDDCRALAKIMQRVTGEKPAMWGASIVGFGKYRYRYASGHSGEMCAIGFAARKGDLSIYLMGGLPDREARLARLGKHKAGKGCLYVKRLADVDLGELESLIAAAFAAPRVGELA